MYVILIKYKLKLNHKYHFYRKYCQTDAVFTASPGQFLLSVDFCSKSERIFYSIIVFHYFPNRSLGFNFNKRKEDKFGTNEGCTDHPSTSLFNPSMTDKISKLSAKKNLYIFAPTTLMN